MQFSLETKTASLSVGEFASFGPGPREGGDGAIGVWRAQLGQHWHNELRRRVLASGAPAEFEVPVAGRLAQRGWTLVLAGRIDQVVGGLLREVKTVTRSLPAAEEQLRADYPEYFLQLAAYVLLRRSAGPAPSGAELVFVETGTGAVQPVRLTAFDEAVVQHQLAVVVDFLEQRHRAHERRRSLVVRPAFAGLRPGQEGVVERLAQAVDAHRIVFFEAPTGFGKTGCTLELALHRLRAGRCDRVVWLTGKSTAQLQVVRTLGTMTAGGQLAHWQVRNKGEHCVNTEFHCVRDTCAYLRDALERWPASGLSRFYLDDAPARDLPALRAAGKEAGICPYEITRAALAYHDFWIGDFNYVFSPSTSGLFTGQPGYDPAHTLLVIDEAHNLPARVADAWSHAANATAAHALLAALDHLGTPPAFLLALERWTRLLASLPAADSLDPAVEAEAAGLIAELARHTTATALDYAALGPAHSAELWRLAPLAEFMAAKFPRLLWSPRAGELSFTCLDAAGITGPLLRQFGGAVLMSATLSPFDEHAAACGVGPDHATLHAPAPWREGAYDVAVDLRVDTTLRQRERHLGTTAATVAQLRAASAGAVAVFFPSYAYAEAVAAALEHTARGLRAAVQPRLPDLAAQAAWIEEHLALSDALFLVLGGSFAESIDALGGRITHALVVGPALPEVNAVQRAKLAVHEAEGGRDAAFRRAYLVPGLLKVNQALGRLVRAPGQRAKVLLHCRRFAEPRYAALLAPEYQLGRHVATAADLADWLG